MAVGTVFDFVQSFTQRLPAGRGRLRRPRAARLRARHRARRPAGAARVRVRRRRSASARLSRWIISVPSGGRRRPEQRGPRRRAGCGADGGRATGLELTEHGPFRRGLPAARRVVEQRDQPAMDDSSSSSALDRERALPRRGRPGVEVEELGHGVEPSEARETGGREHDGVEVVVDATAGGCRRCRGCRRPRGRAGCASAARSVAASRCRRWPPAAGRRASGRPRRTGRRAHPHARAWRRS